MDKHPTTAEVLDLLRAGNWRIRLAVVLAVVGLLRAARRVLRCYNLSWIACAISARQPTARLGIG